MGMFGFYSTHREASANVTRNQMRASKHLQGLGHHLKLQLECAKVLFCNDEEDVVWWEEENLMVDRPTQLICILDFYLSTYKYNRHSRAIW